MAIFLDLQNQHQFQPQTFFKLLTLSLPLFCLLSWAFSTATTAPAPPSSALAASHVLKSRGYSLFAALIAATGPHLWNSTGTVLAPPDFAFSFTAAKFNHRYSPRPRPSSSLFLHHTLKEPLTWHDLSARDNGHELRTWHNNHCLSVSKGFNGNLAITGGKKSISAVKIRHPDLYVDHHLTVHGVDDVIDISSMSNCSVLNRTAEVKWHIDGSFLDHAIRALRRRGFSLAATAMAIKRSDLISLTDVTVFAPSDTSFFSDSDGFRYDFLHHVVPKRHRFTDIARLAPGTAIETLSPNKTVVIGSNKGDATVNGVPIHSSEVYHNRWIVVLSVSRSLDDAGDSEVKAQIPGDESDSGIGGAMAFTPTYSGDSTGESEFPGGISISSAPASLYFIDSQVNSPFPEDTGVRSPSASHSDDFERQAPAWIGEYGENNEAENSRRSPSPSAEGAALVTLRCPPGSSDGVVSTIALAVEGEDLFCPVTVGSLRDLGNGTGVYVEKSLPSNTDYQLTERLVQSGPSHEFNKPAESVGESESSDGNETGQASKVSTAEIGNAS